MLPGYMFYKPAGSRVRRLRQERLWQSSWRCSFTVNVSLSCRDALFNTSFVDRRRTLFPFFLLYRPTQPLRPGPERWMKRTKLSLLVFSYLEPILHVECEVGLQEKEERCWDYAAGDLKGGDGGLRDGFKRRKKSSRGWSVATEHPSSSTPVTCLRGGLMDGSRSGCNPSAWDSTRWEEEEGAISIKSRIYQQSYGALHYTRNTCLFKKCNCDVILFFFSAD